MTLFHLNMIFNWGNDNSYVYIIYNNIFKGL